MDGALDGTCSGLADALLMPCMPLPKGGRSFPTLPAPVLTGLPPALADATRTAALLPGYMAGAWGFCDDLQPPAGLAIISVRG